ncbi:MAG: ExbD/TolR family protein [Longimicrobiales bacterium]
MLQGGFKRKAKATSEIPACSLADMAFLLLIFFMVSTTFRKEQSREILYPEAEATRRLDQPRKDILHLYIERDGQVYINDRNIPMEQVNEIVGPMYTENQALVVVIKADSDVPYQYVDRVQKELQEANALRVTFFASLEQRIMGRR